MAPQFSRERLADLLIDPREEMGIEIKNWLDLVNNNEAKATFAKAALALANHGGGFIVFGLEEASGSAVEASGRPPNLDGYSQDRINGIIQNYADPPFHCAVSVVPDPAGSLFPIIVVPGGHRVPIRSRRSGPNGQTIVQNTIYIRKPGPRSELPGSAQDWDDLLGRCLANRRDDMFDQIRSLITGAVPQAASPPEPARLDRWIERSFTRWDALRNSLPSDDPARCPHGYHWFAYELGGDLRNLRGAAFAQAIQHAVVRHSGWPPFWYPTRAGIQPYAYDGLVECWLGGDTDQGPGSHDAAHSDFWRVSPEGFAFLIRGYQEDGIESRGGREPPSPSTLFDITLPIWRVGEVLLHARNLATALVDGSATINFRAHYAGLAGRELTSLSGRHLIFEGHAARQDAITLTSIIEPANIEANLPEIVQPLLEPLYALFNFFQLPAALVTNQLSELRGSRF